MSKRFEVGELVNFKYRPQHPGRSLAVAGRIVSPCIINPENPTRNAWVVSPIGTRDMYVVNEYDIWRDAAVETIKTPCPYAKGDEVEYRHNGQWREAHFVELHKDKRRHILHDGLSIIWALPEDVRWRKAPPPLQVPAPQNEGVGSKSEQSGDLFKGACKEGTKDDGGKVMYRYLPFTSLEHVNRVLMYGAHKYAPDNWKKVGDGKMRYFDAAMRHLAAWKEEGPKDDGPKGSGLRHLAHAATCCLFALWFEDQELNKANTESKDNGQEQ